MIRGYTQRQEEWLRENVPKLPSWREITDKFNEEFGKEFSLTRLKTTSNRHGIYRTEPLGDKPCWNYKPLGHVCKTSTGYVRVKTEEWYKMPKPDNIAEGMVAVHLGDKDDYSNTMTVSRKALMNYMIQCRWNEGFRRPENKEVALTWCELNVLRKAGEQE